MRGAKLYFLPHPHNGHWPHALRHHMLAHTSALLILLKVAALGIVAITPNTASLSTITANRIVQLSNEERKNVGAAALTINSKLTQAAAQKGQDMLKNQYFAHISPSGVTPWFWMQKNGYSYSVAGENLAIDFVDAENVITAWLNSPSHKANMLSKEYTETGVAVVTGEFQGGTSIIVVHMFGKPLTSSTTPPPVQATPTPTPVPATPKPVPTTLHTPSITPVAAATTTPSAAPSPTPTSTPTPTPRPEIIVPAAPQEPTPPSLVLSPAFDQKETAMVSKQPGTPWQLVSARVDLPSFSATNSNLLARVPSLVLSLSRTTTLAILITLAVLLSLAIFIRIRVQHPALITHASLVIMLAIILLTV